MVERNCMLAQVGGLLDNKGYGIVMKKSSRPVSKAIINFSIKNLSVFEPQLPRKRLEFVRL